MKHRHHHISGTHFCGAPTHDGWCHTLLPNTVVRCDKHAVRVETRSKERKYTSVENVKTGDRVIL